MIRLPYFPVFAVVSSSTDGKEACFVEQSSRFEKGVPLCFCDGSHLWWCLPS